MARMIQPLFWLMALLFAALPARADEGLVPPDVADARAVDAFRKYWGAFEEFEGKRLGEGQKKFQDSWNEVKESFQKERAKLSVEQLDALQRAAAKYRKHLEDHSDAANRPYVMLNLAQIQNLIGDHLTKGDADAGTFAKSEALALLREIEESFRNFSHREQALYLRAVVLESMDREDEALGAWQSLAATAKDSIYGVHANIAVGDHMWTRERPAEAVAAYKKALKLLPDVPADDPAYEKITINYRLAWAAYRSAELETAIQATAELLAPAAPIRSADKRAKMQQDAVDLAGDALYDNNDMNRTKEILRRRELLVFAPAIGLRTLSRYNANGIHGEATNLGESLIQDFPLAKESPEIMTLTADSWQKLGQSPKQTSALEKLAQLLPAQSLWRARHKDDPLTIRRMEERGIPAAIAAAGFHYDTGLASGNPKAFDTAESFYGILVEHSPNAADSNDWRLRRAHCHYFAGSYDDAARYYQELKSDFKVSSEILQIASYQLVLTHEKRWRERFAKAAEKGDNPYQSPEAVESLRNLEQSIDEFAARFPGQGRSVDLLLVGASVNRDMEKLEGATKYWQRALVSQPSPAQRGVAIRGLVFAGLKTGSTGDVVEMARKYLKLEDWRALGLNLGNELRGVLSVAALDEGKRLNSSGKVLEAGLLLTSIAEEFGDLPDRDRIFRDGGYMLAIGGDWPGAQKAAESYLKAGLQKNRGDMIYLQARAQEYQIRLHDAAKAYYDLGEKYPKHVRATTSLQRAEKLAIAENDFDLAALAAAALADQSARDNDRMVHYERAIDHLDKADNPNKALSLANRRLRTSRTPGERLKSRILVARMTYRAGSEQEALDDLAVLQKTIDRDRAQLPAEQYAALAGETSFLLGEEARRKFDDFRLAERSGNIQDNVDTKTRYFEDLVQAYDKAAAVGDPRWAAEARYQLATAAEAFADEIASIPARSGESLNLRSQSRYNTTVERLKGLAKKYYGSNVLAARKNPARYKDNEWVKRSQLRLTGDESARPETKHKDVIPASVRDNLPSQWSL